MLHAAQEERRVMRSGFPISTKSTDPLLRKIMWLYHENDDRHDSEALAEIGRQVNREPKTVLKYILDGTTNKIVFEEDKKKKKDDDKAVPAEDGKRMQVFSRWILIFGALDENKPDLTIRTEMFNGKFIVQITVVFLRFRHDFCIILDCRVLTFPI